MMRLSRWLQPVVEPAAGIGEVNIDGTWAEDHQYLLMAIAVVVALVGIAAAYARVPAHTAPKPSSRRCWPTRWYYDRTVSDFMGGPGREAFEGTAWFDANVDRRRRQRHRAARAAHCRRAAQGAERLRARLRRDHRPRCRGDCSSGSSSGASRDRRLAFPILTMIVLVPVVGSRRRGDHVEAPARPRASSSPCSPPRSPVC